ncbi:PKD-like family lipoprotein [Sphingobacterium hungaricum]
MKLILNLLIISTMISCSDDLGNYTYTDINRITISGLGEDESVGEKSYDIIVGDTIKLSPTVLGTISKDDTSDLSFFWVVENDTVSTSKDLVYKVPTVGQLYCSFIVIDNTTNLTSQYNFFINGVNIFKYGYYILTEKDNGDAALYIKSAVDLNKPVEEVFVQGFPNWGKHPLSINGTNQTEVGNVNSYYYSLAVAIKDGINNVIYIDSRQFLPTMLYNSTSSVEPIIFSPTHVLASYLTPNKIYAVNNGKIYILRTGTISLPKYYTDPLDYFVEKDQICSPFLYEGSLLSFFDKKNNVIRMMGTGGTTEDNYITSYETTLTDSLTKDKTYLLGSEILAGFTAGWYYLMKKDNSLYSYKVTISSSKIQPIAQVATKDLTTIGVNINDISQYYYNQTTNYWYFSVGRSIYRCSYTGLNFVKYVDLPADDTGSIIKFNITQSLIVDPKKMVIATYNPNSTNPKKGSFYVYSTSTTTPQLQITSKYSIDKCVSAYAGI